MRHALRVLSVFVCFLMLAPSLARAAVSSSTPDDVATLSVDAPLVVDAPLLQDEELPGESEPLPGEEGKSGMEDNKVLIIVLAVVAGVALLGSSLICCCCFAYYYY